MHTLKEIELTSLSFNPFEKIGKEWMLISSGTEEKANTMTASWGGLGVMWGKNVAFIVVRQSRYTKEFIDAQNTFSLSFLDETYRSALGYLGSVSGRTENKMEKAGLHFASEDTVPFIEEGKLVFLCKNLSKTPLDAEQFLTDSIEQTWYKDGDFHTLYIAEITKVLSSL